MAGEFQRVERDVPDVLDDIRDPNSTLAARIVVDMSDEIHLYDPNAAPFVTFTKEFRDKREATQYRYDTMEKEPMPRAMVTTAAATSGATTVVVTEGHWERTRAFDLLLNLRTREVLAVGATPTTTSVTVVRQIGSSAGAAIEAGDTLLIISNAHEDGARSGDIKTVAETSDFNYTQIVRRKYGWSGRQAKTKMYGGSDIETERRWQGIEHEKEIEYALLFGRRHSRTGANGRLITSTGGVESFLRSLVWDLDGLPLLERSWIEFLEEGMRYGDGGFQNGNSTKYFICGSRLITIINGWAQDRLQYEVMDDVIGFKAMKYQSPHGDVFILKSAILDEYHPDYGFLIDFNHIRYAYHTGRDTVLVKNREENDSDSMEEEWISDVGLDMELEGSCALIRGAEL